MAVAALLHIDLRDVYHSVGWSTVPVTLTSIVTRIDVLWVAIKLRGWAGEYRSTGCTLLLL